MTTANPSAAIAEELRLVQDDIARLRETAADLRRRIGERDEEPTDPEERSALIEAAEEQEALIDQLEARREELLGQAWPRELTVKVIIYGTSTACTAIWPASGLTGWIPAARPGTRPQPSYEAPTCRAKP